MATQFNDLFSKFIQRKVKSTDFANSYTPDLLSELLNSFLDDARQKMRDIVVEIDGETTDLIDEATESEHLVFRYSFTGTSDTRALTSTPKSGSEFYVTVNNVAWTDFTYNDANNEITINNAPNQTNQVRVGTYFDGAFLNELNRVIEGLLIDFMQLAWIDYQLVSQNNLQQRPYGADYREHSQANHTSETLRLYSDHYDRLYARLYEYTYRQDPTQLLRMGGRYHV